MKLLNSWNFFNHQDETYDDVGVSQSFGNGLLFTDDYHEVDDQVYDDVMPPSVDLSSQENKTIDNDNVSQHVELGNNKEAINLKNLVLDEDKDFIYMSNNNYSLVDEDADDEDTLYDDVGVSCESRVNSIYAGSLNATQLDPSKESEWEDVEESSGSNDAASKSNSQLL